MKKLLILLAVTGICVAIFAADFTVPTQALRATAPISQDLVVTNQNNTVGVTINKSSSSVSSLVQASHDGAVKFAVNTNGAVTSASLSASLPVFSDSSKVLTSKTIANSLLALGIQSGTNTTAANSTVTNTFATAFSSAPKVVVSPFNSNSPTNKITSVSTTAFVVNLGEPSIGFHYIAIGAP